MDIDFTVEAGVHQLPVCFNFCDLLFVIIKYRDMTKKHCPWGRPGAGAPGDRLRRSNILAQGIFPVSQPVRAITNNHNQKLIITLNLLL